MKNLFLILVLALTNLVSAKESDSLSTDNFKKTDEVLAEVVKKAMVVAEKTGEFAIEQAPLLLQEFYTWHIAKRVFLILFALSIFLFGRYLPYTWLTKEPTDKNNVRFFKRYNNEICSYMKDPSASWIIFICTSIISLIIFIVSLYNLVFLLCAPKLYLIEYFIK